MKLKYCNYIQDFELEDEVYDTLLAEILFKPEEVMVYGKKHILKREAARYGDEKSKSYSGIGINRKPIQIWPDILRELCEQMDIIVSEYVSDHTGFNFVICNYYPNGEAYIGYHSDGESDYVEGSCICSLSIGGTRDFLLKSIATKEMKKITLKHGDIFIMKSGFQQLYKHSIPKRKRVDSGRISLTFRCFK